MNSLCDGLTQKAVMMLLLHRTSQRLRKAQDREDNLLFVDLRMPEGGGVELIRQLENAQQRPKIIVCSAFITSELEDEFRSKVACDKG